jgi:hypothetical protein
MLRSRGASPSLSLLNKTICLLTLVKKNLSIQNQIVAVVNIQKHYIIHSLLLNDPCSLK